MSQGKNYTCDMCGGTFEAVRPEGEALAELEEYFPGEKAEDCDQVCDDCWKKIRPVPGEAEQGPASFRDALAESFRHALAELILFGGFSLKDDDKAVLLAALMIILGIVLFSTSWWRAGLALVPAGVLLAGVKKLYVGLTDGFAELLGWKDDDGGSP